jgi:putative hemolysin
MSPAASGRDWGIRMTPLVLFLIGCLAVYVGTIQVAFSALMRLPLRLNAERSDYHGRPDGLGYYLEDPVRLFVPARLLQALTIEVATMLVMVETSARSPAALIIVFGGVTVFVVACGHAVPLLLVRFDPERVLAVLLPSFHAIARGLSPVTRPLIKLLDGVRRGRVDDASVTNAGGMAGAIGDGADAREEQRLLKSVVEFGDTVVREVMTPRPDIVAIKSIATLTDLRAVFADQQYSRIPVYKENLDEILGFVFVKDLVALHGTDPNEQVIERLRRPVYGVPETKRVAELLKEFQRQQIQSAIVHDEYGGTAGLVTIEDLLEEIVGEIRDEYDVELDPIVDEGDGSFVFAGSVGVDDVADRLQIRIERLGFETVGGYLLARLGRVPRVGEHLNVDDVQVEILEGERRRVQRVRMRRQPTVSGVYK